jgi:pSer/pThr/pTyr-binding forkhead associated (FHA) protein
MNTDTPASPGSASAASAQAAEPPRPYFLLPEFVLVDWLDDHGRVHLRQRFALTEGRRTFIIGRSIDADVTVDDDYAAPLHASVEVTVDGRLLARDLGSINGIVVAGKRHQARAAGGISGVPLDDGMLQIGRSRLRLRTSHASLAPELPDKQQPGRSTLLDHPGRLAAIGAVAVAAQSTYNAWLDAPRDLIGNIVSSLTIAAVLTVAWVAVWALLSRVMQNEWRWLRHTAIILGIVAVTVAIDAVLDLGWFMFALPQWSVRDRLLSAVVLAAALSLHLMHASGLTARRAALIGCLIPALLTGGGYWMLDRMNRRNVNHIDAELRIYPPNLRMSPAIAASDYFDGAKDLRKRADSRLKDLPAEDLESYD